MFILISIFIKMLWEGTQLFRLFTCEQYWEGKWGGCVDTEGHLSCYDPWSTRSAWRQLRARPEKQGRPTGFISSQSFLFFGCTAWHVDFSSLTRDQTTTCMRKTERFSYVLRQRGASLVAQWLRIHLQWGEVGSISGSGRSPAEWNVFLPGKSDGQRSLAGYSPWGYKRVGLSD